MNLKEQLMVQELYTKQAKDNGDSNTSTDAEADAGKPKERKVRKPRKPKVSRASSAKAQAPESI